MKNNNYNSVLPKELIKLGYNLETLGIAEIAWKSEDIMKVIDFLIEKKYIILGGDVYLLNGKELEFTYDSWYIEESSSPSLVEESRKKAYEYINEYVKNNGQGYMYSVVFEISQ